jgi:hypothetical protein
MHDLVIRSQVNGLRGRKIARKLEASIYEDAVDIGGLTGHPVSRLRWIRKEKCISRVKDKSLTPSQIEEWHQDY